MIQKLFIVRVVFHHYWPSKLVFLMGYNYDRTYLGRQKIGEADCNDISLWCHLYWCSWPNQEEVERKMCYRRWFKTIWSSLLCSKGKGIRLWFHLCVMYNTVWTLFFLHEQTTLTALGEMFEAARSIMSWLGECAKVCSSSFVIYFISVLYLNSVLISRWKAEHIVSEQQWN